jgi:corrinoid protein of di/trimethylamine methyltransferase
MSELAQTIKDALLTFEQEKLEENVRKQLRFGRNPLEIVNAITAALTEIGELFQKGELFLPHLVMAGEAVKSVISNRLEPLLKTTGAERKTSGRVVIGTVAGDIHDIGKSIVASMLFSAGFDVTDLGKDVPVDEFIKAVKEQNPVIVAMSALLSTTLPIQKEVIEVLKKNGLRDKVKVIVGGAPATAEWAEEIGADGYAADAVGAVKIAKKLCEEKN